MIQRSPDDNLGGHDLREITELTTFIALALRATGVLEGADEASKEYAGDIVEAEFRAFWRAEGDYADALRNILAGTKPEGSALALVVITCAEKILAFRENKPD